MAFPILGQSRRTWTQSLGLVLLVCTVNLGCDSQSDDHSKTESTSSGVEGSPPLENGLPPHCEPLSDDADLLGYCLYSLAGGFPAKSEMERLCGLAGDWEGDCRHAWVAGRMKDEENYETTELLEICADNSDCSFEVLDFRPHPDLKEQLERCRRYAGTHHADCAGHAAQRWWGTSPSAEEIAQMGALDQNFYADKVGWWIGVSVQCAGIGTCEGLHPDSAKFCESAVKTFQTELKGKCPDKRPRDMHHRGRNQPQENLGQQGRGKPQ